MIFKHSHTFRGSSQEKCGTVDNRKSMKIQSVIDLKMAVFRCSVTDIDTLSAAAMTLTQKAVAH